MLQSGSLPTLLLLLSFTFSIETDTRLLSPPQKVRIESTNMKHLLKWSPLQVSCGTVTYSVQFQGEFELQFLNGSWENALDCQSIHENVCDLTPDLASDSDYDIRVRAECGGRVSRWTSPGTRFNRRETNLSTPDMKVNVSGDFIHVEFADLPRNVDIILTHWKQGQELSASRHHITAEWNPFHLGRLESGATYCLSAQALLHNINKSTSTETKCFSISESMLPWLKPTAVFVAVVIIMALGLAAFWSLTRCCPTLLHACWPKEQLPKALLHGEAVNTLRVRTEEELRELYHSLQVLDPSQLEREEEKG
ncbi:cytokine receptor family member B16 [Megalops cyprinoides]|uniref:cytokine receptor family member B16 n=1 Tax=Megalops cyprinoides TaxID=118141 RepID=UPI0018640C66|nr:cytokine receptor family member B16 [Megalops cyprinoides]